MATIATRPSTVDGIKRFAKSIKRDQGIPHQKALEIAAKQSGFQNFVHAKRSLSSEIRSATSDQEKHLVYLTAYWRESKGMPRHAGRETLEIKLSQPLTAFIARHQVRHARNLRGFKLEAGDHLEMITDADSQDRALSTLTKAADTLRFLEATSLIPASNQTHFTAMRIANDLPGKDHYSWWLDPTSRAWLALDEPYEFSEERQRQRDTWAKNNGLWMTRPNWPGLYYPGQSIPFLISPNSDLIARVVSQVESLDPDDPAARKVMSEGYFTAFTSPARIANGSSHKNRPGPSYGQRMGAVPYGGRPGIASNWRPATPLPLDIHTTIGPMLHALCNTGNSRLPGQAYKKINMVRSTLEDWAFIEHKHDITREVEEKLYYGPGIDGYSTTHDTLKAIENVRNALLAGYGECKPRRDLIAQLDAAIKDVATKTARI